MKKRHTREKKTLCGERYMEVDLYRITPEEHAAKRGKKTKPSSERQKKRNAQHSHRLRVQKANANFTVLGFYPDLHRGFFAGEQGAGPAGSAQLHPPGESCHRKTVRPGR